MCEPILFVSIFSCSSNFVRCAQVAWIRLFAGSAENFFERCFSQLTFRFKRLLIPLSVRVVALL